IEPFESAGHWSYSGPTASLGAMVDIRQIFRAAGTLTWSGTLEADPSPGTEGARREYDMPLDVRAGLSVALSPQLNVSGSFAWSDWSDTAEDLAVSGDGAATAVGAGIEFSGASLFG